MQQHPRAALTSPDQNVDRRRFLAASALGVPLATLGASAAASAVIASPVRAIGRAAGPVSISSANGVEAVARAVELINGGGDPTDAVVDGVSIVENDPDDMSVGYGGLPNEEGVVELDSSVMHGPTHKAGAVAGLRNIKNPAAVALRVLKRTDHVLLVGEGAYRFAIAQGFKHEELLTERARRAWLRWKENLNPADDWLDDSQRVDFGNGDDDGDEDGRPQAQRGGPRDMDPREAMARAIGVPWSWGTIHCSAIDANGSVGACTTTSGLSYKIPGRVGDSPIIGAGMFVDNQIGAAGATGRGESVIQSCGSFQIVQAMGEGLSPTDACLKALKWIADHTRRHDLLNDRGEPNFDVTFYALRKDGAYGSAVMRGEKSFAVCEADGTARRERCAPLF